MMQKFFSLELFVFLLFLCVKKGETLKCFICRSDNASDCGLTVSLSHLKECPPKDKPAVCCRKISQILIFKNEKYPTYIRECGYEKGSSPCYRFNWISVAKQNTCECDQDQCNHGLTNIPCILTIVFISSLALIYNFLKKDHT